MTSSHAPRAAARTPPTAPFQNNAQRGYVAQVSKAYYNVIINKERIKLLEANILRLKKIFDDTKAFNQQGFAELIDVERLEVQLNNLLTEKDKIVKLIGLSETMLKFQMGYKLDENQDIAVLGVDQDSDSEWAPGVELYARHTFPNRIFLQAEWNYVEDDFEESGGSRSATEETSTWTFSIGRKF